MLAMVLRTRPDALTLVLPELRESPTYQGQDKLPVIIWMMAQVNSDKKKYIFIQICCVLFKFVNIF